MLWRCGQAEYRRACLGVCSTAPHTKSPSFASLLGSPPARFQVEICAQLSPFLQRLGSAELCFGPQETQATEHHLAIVIALLEVVPLLLPARRWHVYLVHSRAQPVLTFWRSLNRCCERLFSSFLRARRSALVVLRRGPPTRPPAVLAGGEVALSWAWVVSLSSELPGCHSGSLGESPAAGSSRDTSAVCWHSHLSSEGSQRDTCSWQERNRPASMGKCTVLCGNEAL